jgi:hypothetical protein
MGILEEEGLAGGGAVQLSTSLQNVPWLTFPKLYILYPTVLTPSYQPEQFILNFFLNSILGIL